MIVKDTRNVWRFRIFLCLVLLILGSVGGMAQDITSGAIQGVVTDEQGAGRSRGDSRRETSQQTLSRSFTTDGDGRFTITWHCRRGVMLFHIRSRALPRPIRKMLRLPSVRGVVLTPTLKVSGVSGEVTITQTPTVDTTKTEASTTINQTAITNTPILGRKFEDLLTLTPGVRYNPGAGRRRDKLLGPTRHFQQRQPLTAAITITGSLASRRAVSVLRLTSHLMP